MKKMMEYGSRCVRENDFLCVYHALYYLVRHSFHYMLCFETIFVASYLSCLFIWQ